MFAIPRCLVGVAACTLASCLTCAAWGQARVNGATPLASSGSSPAAQPAPAGGAADGVASVPTVYQVVPLKAVQVNGQQPPFVYNEPQTGTATGTPTLTLNVPQSIQVIPRQVLIDQGAQSLAAAVRNAPGVYVQQGEGNRDEFYLRGVKTKSDFFVDGLRDDTEYYRPLYNVAHVDVLEGPAAILFGRGGAGGIINLVTKQPVRRSIRHASLHVGSWPQKRATLDVGGAMGPVAAFRVMAMGERSGGFRDHYFLHRYAINPKFRFRPGEHTEIDVGASFLDDRRRADRGIPSHAGRPADVPRSTFFGSPQQNVARSRVSRFTLRIKHRFNDHLALRNALLATENDRMYQNVYPGGPVDAAGLVKLNAYHHPSNRLSYLDRLELIADFETGAVAHTLVVGSELGWQRGNDRETLPADDSKSLPDLYPATQLDIGPVAFAFLDRNNHVVGREIGVFAEDQIAIGEHWKALAGVRWDRFSVAAHYYKSGVSPDYTHHVDTDVSPRIGVIYKPVDNDSVYASVTQTFTPQGANIALSQKDPTTAQLAPEEATNVEIGNKLDLMDGALSVTAAAFQLDLKDVVSKAADGSGRLVNTGRQRNRGVALSVQGALTSHWSVYANYTHLTAKITRATEDAAAGARVGLVPRDQFSLWTRYAFDAHWGVGAGLCGASRKYTSYDNDVVLPGFAEADAMAYYQNDRYRIQLNVDNLTDRVYYPTASGDNQIMPGAPRHVSLSVSFDF